MKYSGLNSDNPSLLVFVFAFSRVRDIQKANELELEKNISDAGSWHEQYDSPHIFVGGLPFELNEGDLKTIFEQY